MRNLVMLSRFGALCVALLFLGAGRSALRAQPAAEALPAKPASPGDLSRDELLKSYLQLQEKLHAAELAIVNNRLESEAAARAQVAAITERLDAIKADMAAERARQQLEAQRVAAERERQQAEAQRVAAERERQQAEAQRSYRIVLYVASAIGGVGLLAMLLTTLFQWRSISRIAEVMALRPPFPAQAQLGVSPNENGAPSGEAVALSNQRLLSVVQRMERLISELEHTAVHPLPAAPAKPPGKSDSPRRAAVTAAKEVGPKAP